MELTKDFAYCELQKILQDKVLLVVGTGASMALDIRFGMGALSEELIEEIPKHIDDNDEAKKQWEQVEGKLKNAIDLESALEKTKDESLIRNIVQVSGDFLAGLDKEYKLKILNNRDRESIPIEHFIEKSVRGLPEYAPVLDVITPNYDLLIEHCCDNMNIPFVDGFLGGLEKHEDWEKAKQQMVYTKSVPKGKKYVEVKRSRKHLRLYKVHGSLNWFIKNGQIIEDSTFIYHKFSEIKMERFIITPGDSKYKKELNYNIDCFKRAYERIRSNRVFVFIGYGFNDDHIHNHIKKELIDKKKQGIIITKQLSPNAEKFLEESDKLWAIYHVSDNHETVREQDTLIYNKAFEHPLEIKNQSIWNIKNFSKEVLGE